LQVQTSENIKDNKVKPSKLPLLISLSLLALLIACYFLVPSFHETINKTFKILTSDDEESIKIWVGKFGMAGPLVLILIMVVQMFLLVIPNVLLMMVAIIMYGPVWGAIISLMGVFVSSSFGYFIGRKLGPVTVNKLISIKTQLKISRFIEEYGTAAIAITRISSFSNDSLSIVAGLLKMSYRKYILATLCGITPLITLLALYGRSGRIEKALLWIAAASLVILIVYIFVDKKLKRKRSQSKKQSPQITIKS
jgi:uncharacterized membrane protein YdjX (TVP38/TMEM64 family)